VGHRRGLNVKKREQFLSPVGIGTPDRTARSLVTLPTKLS